MTTELLPTRIKEWLNARGIHDSIIDSFGIHWNGSQIVIPVHDANGNVLFNKYRRDPDSTEGPKYKYEKGATSTLFGLAHPLVKRALDTFSSAGHLLVICEGELDCLRLLSEGVPAVTSTGGASTFQESWSEILQPADVFICLDTDDAGIKGALRIHSMIPRSKIIKLPKGVKDVTEFFLNPKGRMFSELIKDAVSFSFPSEWRGLETKKELGAVKKEYEEYLAQLLGRIRYFKGRYEDARYEELLRDHYLNKLNEVKRAIKFFQVKRKDFDKDRLARAKTAPIDMYIKFNNEGFAPCIWHNEKTGSMYWYKKQGRVKCFGCDKMGDVIDVIQQLNHCNLSDAIKIILNEAR